MSTLVVTLKDRNADKIIVPHERIKITDPNGNVVHVQIIKIKGKQVTLACSSPDDQGHAMEVSRQYYLYDKVNRREITFTKEEYKELQAQRLQYSKGY